MSDLILPLFRGFGFERSRTPQFKTIVSESKTGKQSMSTSQAFPVWLFKIPINYCDNLFVKDADMLIGFYLRHRGQLETWLYDCPRYNRLEKELVGITNDSKKFFLKKSYPFGFEELIHFPKNDLEFFIGEDKCTIPFIENKGKIEFETAPQGILTCSGGYYHRCRFDNDVLTINEFSTGNFDAKDFSFIGSVTDIFI